MVRSRGGSAPGRSAPGGAWSWGDGIPACIEAEPPPGETATAADGTHPHGMRSCSLIFSLSLRLSLQ